MNRREFIKYSAVTGLTFTYPTIALSKNGIVIKPSGGDDTQAINAALTASARTGDVAILANGAFTITDTILVPSGARLLGKGLKTPVSFQGGKVGVVMRIEEPHVNKPIEQLYVEDRRFPVPFFAKIG